MNNINLRKNNFISLEKSDYQEEPSIQNKNHLDQKESDLQPRPTNKLIDHNNFSVIKISKILNNQGNSDEIIYQNNLTDDEKNISKEDLIS